MNFSKTLTSVHRTIPFFIFSYQLRKKVTTPARFQRKLNREFLFRDYKIPLCLSKPVRFGTRIFTKNWSTFE